MKRTFAVLNPVQFIPGEPAVMIPVTQVEPSAPNRPLEQVDATRDDLVTTDQARAALEAIEAGIIADAQAKLLERYAGDDVEVITMATWRERQAAAAQAAADAAAAQTQTTGATTNVG